MNDINGLNFSYHHTCAGCAHTDKVPLGVVISDVFQRAINENNKKEPSIGGRLVNAAPAVGIVVGACVGALCFNSTITGIAVGAITGVVFQSLTQ